jgi:hypothetical protein
MALCKDCAAIRIEDLLTGYPSPWKGTVSDFHASAVHCKLCALFHARSEIIHTISHDEVLYIAGLCHEKATPPTLNIVVILSGTLEDLRAWDGTSYPAHRHYGEGFKDKRLKCQIASLSVYCAEGAPHCSIELLKY